MSWGKIRQVTALVVWGGVLHAAVAEIGSDWEDAFEYYEDNLSLSQKGLNKEEYQVPPENGLEGEEITLVLPPQKSKVSHKGFAMVPLANRNEGIRDETAITGENAKVRLPAAVKREKESFSLFQDISHIIPSYTLPGLHSPETEE